MIRRKIALGTILLAAAFAMPAPVHAQSRAARLQEHERKIQEIIRERRARAKEEEAKRAEEEAAQQADGTEEPPTKDEGPPKPVSNVVMGLKFKNMDGESSYNVIVRNGTNFLTEVQMFNIDQNPVDRVRLAIDFDKRFIEPVKIFDTSLRPYIDGEPEFTIDERDAVINYSARLREPLVSPETTLVRIMWRTIRPTPYTGIDFVFSPLERDQDTHTAIYARNQNILGLSDDPADGVLSGGLMIEPENESDEILQGKAEELEKIYLGGVAADADVGLQLQGPKDPVRVGDKFVVHVRLNNPDGALLDAINFAVLFDPKVVRVVDEDKYNYIIRGINVHDGSYHRNFPWDLHRRNEVRNDRGLAVYQMSLSNGASLPSRTFADIHFLAIAPTTETAIGFVKGRPGAPNLTSVRYFGYEKLDLESEVSTPNLYLPILNAPPEIAKAIQDDPELIESEAVTEQALAVRPLKIER